MSPLTAAAIGGDAGEVGGVLMFKRLLLTLGVTVFLLGGECFSIPLVRDGSLEIIATDVHGKPLTGLEIELSRLDSGDSRATVDGSLVRAAYGVYRLGVRIRGFRPAWREVHINQAAAVARIELEVGSIGCPPEAAEIRGQIRRNGRNGELWVKAVPVRGISGGEARVSSLGYFLISGLASSSYVLLVMEGETVLHQDVVRALPAGEDGALSIELRR
jgi:hypothetical protein